MTSDTPAPPPNEPALDSALVPFKAALGSFLDEFAKFETLGVRIALHTLSRDAEFADRAEKLLDSEARLTLLKRVALARNIPPLLIAELDELLSRARKLRHLRDEVARIPLGADGGDAHPTDPPLRAHRPWSRRRAAETGVLATEPLWIPQIKQLLEYAIEAVRLRDGLCAILDRVNRPASPAHP